MTVTAQMMRRLDLSPIERSVLENAAWGYTQIEAAHRLGIDYQTLKAHRRRVVRKLGAKNMENAIYLFFGRG